MKHRDAGADVPSIALNALLGSIAIALFLLGFGAWAALAPLASAAVAQGQLKFEGNRRVVQNLEGGVIREILVQDGSLVEAGQVLLRLHDEQTGASAELLSALLDSQRALRARLLAEALGAEAIDFPPELRARRGQPRVAEMLDGQEAIFRQRRRTLDAQSGILRRRIGQLGEEIGSYEAIARSQENQLVLIREEASVVEALLRQGFERKPRLLALQRSRDQQRSLVARAEQGIGETEMQLRQLVEAFQRDVITELRDVEARIVDAGERQRAASDIQARREIAAPAGGMVMNLRFTTVGGVVRPGEPILEIAPAEDRLVVEISIQPQDIDVVGLGQRAEVRLTAFRQRVVPQLQGHVVYVAGDAVAGERNAPPAYRVHVAIDPEQLDKLRRATGVAPTPGMPAEVLIFAGERTFLDYMVRPLLDSFRRAFREQ
jgi:HlyD family type I secretion membrane fusion protein